MGIVGDDAGKLALVVQHGPRFRVVADFDPAQVTNGTVVVR